jgi:hypothetical protein
MNTQKTEGNEKKGLQDDQKGIGGREGADENRRNQT